MDRHPRYTLYNEFQFKVPLEVRERAREELKKRGWRKKGSRWEYGL
jgi:hypothetical protein